MTSHPGTEPSTEAGLLKQAQDPGPESIPRPPSSSGAEATALPPPVCSVRHALALHGGPNLVTSWRIQAAAKAAFWVQHHVGLPSAFSKGERIKFSLDGKLAPLGLVTPLLGRHQTAHVLSKSTARLTEKAPGHPRQHSCSP